ncbi:hypothetical protein AWENTII_007944 [Aspergillus wentii]
MKRLPMDTTAHSYIMRSILLYLLLRRVSQSMSRRLDNTANQLESGMPEKKLPAYANAYYNQTNNSANPRMLDMDNDSRTTTGWGYHFVGLAAVVSPATVKEASSSSSRLAMSSTM